MIFINFFESPIIIDSSCFILICKAVFNESLSCRQMPKSLNRVGKRKIVSL